MTEGHPPTVCSRSNPTMQQCPATSSQPTPIRRRRRIRGTPDRRELPATPRLHSTGVDPAVNVDRIEADQLPDPMERDPPFLHQPPNEPIGDAETFGSAVDIEQCIHRDDRRKSLRGHVDQPGSNSASRGEHSGQPEPSIGRAITRAPVGQGWRPGFVAARPGLPRQPGRNQTWRRTERSETWRLVRTSVATSRSARFTPVGRSGSVSVWDTANRNQPVGVVGENSSNSM